MEAEAEREKLILIWLVLVPLQRRRHGGAQSFASSVIYLAQKVFSASESVLGAHTLGLYGAPIPLGWRHYGGRRHQANHGPGFWAAMPANRSLARPPAPCAAELSLFFMIRRQWWCAPLWINMWITAALCSFTAVSIYKSMLAMPCAFLQQCQGLIVGQFRRSHCNHAIIVFTWEIKSWHSPKTNSLWQTISALWYDIFFYKHNSFFALNNFLYISFMQRCTRMSQPKMMFSYFSY